jgi:iron complex outermembrane recepter protein
MSNIFTHSLFATTALALALPTAALAQTAPADEASADESDVITVTARRESENLQDVPVSIQVVTGDAIQKAAITDATELSKVAPGLNISNVTTNEPKIELRGVTWRPGSGTPAIPIYFNEAPFDPSSTIQTLFDIGQVEVLRGPQGTSRGASSISGAVTITTRKPDLSEFGGYVQGLYGTADHVNLQGAVNAPIIKDKLAVRFAANIDDNEANRVNSINNPRKPGFKTTTFRGSLLFAPTETLRFETMFQRLAKKGGNYDQVVGTGSPGAPAGPLAFLGLQLGAIPANFNGPALTAKQRASVQDGQSTIDYKVDHLTANASWEVAGQLLSVNYGRQKNRSKPQFNAQDQLNFLPGYEPTLRIENAGDSKFRTLELRLSSGPDSDSPFSYDLGYFSRKSGGTVVINNDTHLSGAFGSPTTLPGVVTTPNRQYVLASRTNIALGQNLNSLYGNVKYKLGEKTEFSAGVSRVRDRVTTGLATTTFAATSVGAPLGLIAFNFPPAFRPLITSCESLAGFGVPGLVTSANYPGVCDSPVPAGVGNSTQNNNDKYKATIYNFSLSHKFTDDVLVYATTGSSFRSGLPAINNVGLPAGLTTPLPEKAKSYELGIKSSLGRRVNLNAAVFQINYDNQLTTFEGVQYFNTTNSRVARTSIAFYRNVDARVRGFEVSVAARPTDNLELGANLAYSKIKSQGGNVPCNDPTRPITAANPINTCPSPKGQVLNQESPFSANLNGGYTVPFGSLEGYFRFNLAYKGRNPNFGNFLNAGSFKKTPSYAIVDLFAGVAGEKSVWDVGFYAKNVFNEEVELSRVTPLNNIYAPYAAAPGGYDQIRLSPPREVGIQARFAFGSR